MAEIVVIHWRVRLFMATSLKDKRRLRQKLDMRLLKRYNISQKETAYRDILNDLHMATSHVALSFDEANRFAAHFRNSIEDVILGEGELARYEVDMINYK